MDLKELYGSNKVQKIGNLHLTFPRISFEVFPPKDGNISDLFDEVRVLKKYNPVLVSLTYGANGGTKVFSLELIRTFIDLELNVMPHYTCVGSSVKDVEKYVTTVENMGVENILALRGDIPSEGFLSDGMFRYANELVDFIKSKSTLSIGVAGYPEGHIECEDLKTDIENLKRKVDSGADVIFTQLFYDNDKFFKYVDLVRKAGITIPIVPGIMPIRSLKQLNKMVEMANVTIPECLSNKFEKYPNEIKKIGLEYVIEQCQSLINSGVCGLHFYTLNHADLTSEILDSIML